MAPVIWDIGTLDCVARLLPSPIEMIFYLKCRSDVFDRVVSDSEYNFLGYHIRTKLAIAPDVDVMLLDRDFATVVDDYMISAELGIVAERPLGALERMKMPAVSDLLSALKKAPPEIASIVVDLYDLSGAALKELSDQIIRLRHDVFTTGKAIKAMSLQTASGGLTYAVTMARDNNAFVAAAAIGRKHKYDTKSDRWYVILDSVETKSPVDGLLPLVWPWKDDKEDAKDSEDVGKKFKSWQEATAFAKPRDRV